MDLLELILGSPPPRVLGVLGSGGKTALITLLARELAARNLRVLVTTSTKVYPFPGLPFIADPFALPEAFRNSQAVFLGRQLDAEVKLAGPDYLDLEILREGADVLLIEGDGARRRPLKVHLPHDPVLPEGVDLALMLLGASAIGAVAGTEIVHRLDQAPTHWELHEGEVIEAGTVARMALAADGYRGKTGGAALRILVNQADANPEGARALAVSLRELWTGPIYLGSAQAGTFEAMPSAPARPALILLAAGSSRRWPGEKLDARLGDHSVLEWSLRAWRGLSLEDRLIVCREAQDHKALAEGFRPLRCARPERGMSESLHTGLAALGPEATGVLIALADMPALRPSTLRRLLAAVAEAPSRVHRPRHNGKPGHPVHIPRESFDKIAVLTGDRGLRDVLDSWDPIYLDVDDAGVVLDLDRPSDAGPLECLLMEEREDNEAR